MSVSVEAEEAVCVRLGAGTETAPEILRVLAREGSVTVRAAVAMNVATPADADQRLALDGDERVRALLARKLASLVPDMVGQRPDKVGSVDPNRQALDALVALAADTAVRVRAAIADVVKQMPEAPRALILQLARDTVVAVSDPVIRLSPVLTTDDLLVLLANPPSLVTAVSVARRPNLSETISDAITATADSAAIRALLSNPSAAIREATLDALIAIAPARTEWHSPLVNRPVLTAHAARALSEIVASQLLETLASRPDIDPDLATDLRKRISETLERQPEAPRARSEPTAEEAMDEAYALHRDGLLYEETVIEALQRGEARRVAAMLAVAADMPLSVVDRAASLRSAKGLISLVWQAGFSMRVAAPLQAMLAHIAPTAILPAGPGGTFPLAAEEMRWQLDFLKRMRR
jgi:uncharacterized protein (DUF2336 family)